MMATVCERCKSRPASVQVQRTANGATQRLNLCYACAEEVGAVRRRSAGDPFGSFPGFEDFFDAPFFGRGGHEHAGIPERAPRAEQVNILDAFSERAKGVIQTAAEQAQAAGSPALDTEHLLIGAAEEQDVSRKILENVDIDPEDLVAYLKENMTKDAKQYEEGVAPDLSPRAKQALELAWHAARNLEHDYVGSEHILIGLLEEGDGLAAQTLKKYGMSETKLRQAVLSAVGEKGKKTGKVKEKSVTPTLD